MTDPKALDGVFVHATAIVDDGALIGKGTKIWHWVHVSKNSVLGERCVLGQNVFIAPGVKIGNGVKIQNNVSVYDGVEIDDDAFLGPSCVFTNVNNPRSFIERKDEFRKTRVGRGASIGANATIVCGHDIGEYAFIGAGSVVTKHVPAFALVVGSPSKLLGWVCRCGVRLAEPAGGSGETRCVGSGNAAGCGDRYRITAGDGSGKSGASCVRLAGA
jgi:UDP-2-acetamido-3-amino-2,3-dideoxy-glucuronate N-acetyltransferase